MATLRRQALGEAASLGSLYDARTDSFIPLSLLNGPPPAKSISVTDMPKTDIRFIRSETNREKLSNMNISAELSASFLSGLVKADGSLLEASLVYNITTKSEALRLNDEEVKNALAFKSLKTSTATHVVIGIEWGANSITNIEGHFKLAGGSDATVDGSEEEDLLTLEFTVFGDVLAEEDATPLDIDSALRYMRNVPQSIKKANDRKGKPIVYTLLPIEILSLFWMDEIQIEIDSHYRSIGAEYLEKFVQLFDQIHDIECALNDYHSFIMSHSTYVPIEHLKTVRNNRDKVRQRQASLKTEYAKLLQEIRGGKDKFEELTSLYKTFHQGDDAPENLTNVVSQYSDKIDFIDAMVCKGARYIRNDGFSVDSELARNDKKDVFVFWFTESARKACEYWRDLFALLLSLAEDEWSEALVLLVDEGEISSHPGPTIVQYRDGNMIVKDVYEERKLLREKCLTLYDKGKLERHVAERPLARRPVSLPCPGTHCNQTITDEWVCRVCQVPVQYGHTNRYIYCDCGRALYSDYAFRCNRPSHGSAYTKYDNNAHLEGLLDKLEPFQELNILILGEAGVGKSTFINAFFNYIKYEDMEEALEADKLAWLIPCAFSTQRVDPDDPDGRLVETRIRIGSSDSELDSSSGQSATQETAFYPFQLGDVTDQKNMANVLNVLSQFEKIHGIIILLKPNTSRLNVIFRFCIEELLTHLHRDATQNMVFGFTNARSSNYQPGDTFVPLQSMLKRYGESENIGTSEKLSLGLYQHNTYYFDSERIDLGNRQEYINSWNFSAGESRRLLRYFRGLKPHHVKNTLSLNNTRKTITSLTKPMAEIIQVINATIALNEETIKGLRDKEVSVEELKLKLNIQQVQLHSETLDMPRTVCSNMSCVEYRDGRNGTKVAFYEQSCHDPCYLDNVDADTIAHAQLINCSAFSGKSTCSKCQHVWQQHLHVMYHLNEVTVTVPDPEIQEAITQNNISIKTKRDAIRKKNEAIKNYRLEHSKIQQAAKDKISVGGTIDRLERLERSRQEYKQLIETVQMSLKNNDEQRIISREEVEIRVKELFDLKYYGEQLRKAVSVIDKAHSGTYREKPNKTLHVSNKKGKK
ncbi:hypothetical protein F4806DRAFT_505347 [Annulohypoxylon nitens]|nr:hypothetical protein F4806DRAFT_505347 [Annulohypoxylon nitens]